MSYKKGAIDVLALKKGAVDITTTFKGAQELPVVGDDTLYLINATLTVGFVSIFYGFVQEGDGDIQPRTYDSSIYNDGNYGDITYCAAQSNGGFAIRFQNVAGTEVRYANCKIGTYPTFQVRHNVGSNEYFLEILDGGLYSYLQSENGNDLPITLVPPLYQGQMVIGDFAGVLRGYDQRPMGTMTPTLIGDAGFFIELLSTSGSSSFKQSGNDFLPFNQIFVDINGGEFTMTLTDNSGGLGTTYNDPTDNGFFAYCGTNTGLTKSVTITGV